MRKILLLIPVLLIGCGTEAPTSLATREAGDALFGKRTLSKNYTAPLSGREEVSDPPVETRAQGLARFQLSADGGSVSYRLNVANIENVSMAHIHLAPFGENGPVVVWLYPDAPPPQLIPGRTNGPLMTGTFTAADLVGPLADADLEVLLAAMMAGRTYVNVHTSQYPGGEIRGQIKAGG